MTNPVGWVGMRADGSTVVFEGAAPNTAYASEFASVTEIDTSADLEAAIVASRTMSAAASQTPASLIEYATQKLAAVLAAGKTFNVAASGQPAVNILCDGTSATRADLGLMGLFGQQSPTGTQVWVDNNGVTSMLTGTQIVTLVTEAGLWIAGGYAALGAAFAAIGGPSSTITTRAQIDTAFAAL